MAADSLYNSTGSAPGAGDYLTPEEVGASTRLHTQGKKDALLQAQLEALRNFKTGPSYGAVAGLGNGIANTLNGLHQHMLEQQLLEHADQGAPDVRTLQGAGVRMSNRGTAMNQMAADAEARLRALRAMPTPDVEEATPLE